MTALAVATAMLAAWVVVRTPPVPARRLKAVLPGAVEQAGSARAAERHLSPGRLAGAAGAIVVGALFVGGGAGILVGAVLAGAIAFLRPAPKATMAAPDEVAVVVDLVAGCLDAGVGLPDALDAAARAAESALGSSCRAIAAGLRSGAPPIEVWRPWLADPSLAPVARMAVRTGSSGAAAAADLRRTATRIRSRRRAAAQDRVRKASVWLVAPLGLCFLPAFVLVAVAPLVIGLIPALR